MNIDIHAESVELNKPLRTFIEEKMADLDRSVSTLGESSARVEVGIPSQHHNSGPIFYAEVNLKTPRHLFRAEMTHHDLHAAIVDVKDDLKNQIAKFKDKMREEHRQPAE